MKHIYIKFWSVLGCILCISPLVFSQTPDSLTIHEGRSWTLDDSTMTGTHTYIALDSIVLMPGFSYEATNGNVFTGKVYQLLPPTWDDDTNPDGTNPSNPNNPTQGGAVGNLSGALDVSPSGAATYSIPIEIPSGIAGVQPTIALVYNSQVGNGLAGWGVNIAGLSAITRVPKTIYSDGTTAGIKNTASDGYALDGNRLVPYENQYATYHTETETFANITSQGSSVGNGPDWFEVQAKDGTIYKYGSASGRLSYNHSGKKSVQGWMLDYVTAPTGQTIQYEYENVDLYSYIKKITYGDNTIEFVYDENRTDIIPLHFDQLTGKINRRLQRIKCSTSGQLYRQYDLEYKQDDTYSRLSTITEKNGTEESLNPITLNWNALPAFSQTVSSLTIPSTYIPLGVRGNDVSYADQSYISGDLNGDGLADLIGTFPYAEYKYYYNSNKFEVISAKLVYVNWASLNSSENVEFTSGQYFVLGDSFAGICWLMDFDGNGINELVYPDIHLPGRHITFKSIGGNLNNHIFDTFLRSSEMPEFTTADMDNDGRGDIIFIDKGHSSGKYPCYIIGHNQGSEYKASFDLTLPSKPEKLFVADYNGDGLNDVLVFYDKGYTIFWNQGNGISNDTFSDNNKTEGDNIGNVWKIWTGDFNGDGLQDFLMSATMSKEWNFALNNGNGTFTKKLACTLDIYDQNFTDKDNDKFGCQVFDFDFDGKSDVIITKAMYNFLGFSQTYTYWMRSTGTSLVQQKERASSSVEADAVASKYVVGDFNGDGQPELMNYGYNCYDGTTDTQWRMYQNPNLSANSGKVTSITNSLQNKTTLEYASLVNGGIYAKGSGAQYPVIDIQAPLHAVKTVTANAGTTEASATDYTYKGAKIHTQGRGFLGFSETTASNTLLNRKTVSSQSNYHPDYYYPRTTKQFTATISGDTLSTQTATNTHLPFTGKRIFPYTSSQTATDKLTALSATTIFDYDGYGNPTTIKTTKGDLVEAQTLHYVQRGSWCLNKPDNVTLKKEYNGDTYTRTSAYEYNQQGVVTKETTDPDDANKKVVTVYSDFTSFGQPQTIQVTANEQTRTSSVTYYPSGRFVKTKTNHLDETTTYNWNEAKGVLNSEVDHWDRKTAYRYDSWGRRTNTTYPDGLRAGAAVGWASKPTGAKYYAFSQTLGDVPVTVLYDALGREVRTESYGLNQKKIWMDTEYNDKGQVYRVSEPYFSTDTPTAWTTYSYDDYGRVNNITTPMGKTEYKYEGTKTTISSSTDKKETIINSAGFVDSETTNGKKVDFTYYSSGLVKTATPEGRQELNYELSMEYDLQGNRTKLTDPDAGVITSKYDAWGQLTEEKQAIHNPSSAITTTYDYQPSGLLNYKNRNGTKTNYGCDDRHRLQWIGINATSGRHSQSFVYDDYDRITQTTDTVDGNKRFVREAEYDLFGRISRETYPSAYAITNSYDDYGYLTKVSDDTIIWEAKESNARGQLTKTQSGGKETTFGFDNRGFPTSIKTDGITDLAYNFDAKGNLESREDKGASYKESFAYDAMNRLTKWTIGTSQQKMTYDPTTGNIQKKSDLGDYTMGYGDNGKPHALTSISGTPSLMSNTQRIEYTDFKKVKKITENGKTLDIFYGTDEQRIKSVSNASLTRYYMGNYEEEIRNGTTHKIHYISGGNGLAAVLIDNTLYFAHTDFQGSLIALSRPDGTVAERYAYDPWGNRRNPDNWTQRDERTAFLLNRGYTLHEHLDDFKLINMNGRMYDPLTAQFFSPDPYLQAPGDWLNYNRYAYAYGNPFKYTDPNGEWLHLLIGALIGGFVNWASHGFQLNAKGLSYFGVGALAGALGAGVGAGISSALAGGGFGAGFMGTSAAMTATSSFVSGAAIGGGAGFAAGFTSGFGNGLLGGQNVGQALWSGIKDGLIGGASGAAIGGLVGGWQAWGEDRSFWTGKPTESVTWQDKMRDAYMTGYENGAGELDESTLGKNFLGTDFNGPNNPKGFNLNQGKPINYLKSTPNGTFVDYAGQAHDIAYTKMGYEIGTHHLFINPLTKGKDAIYVAQQLYIGTKNLWVAPVLALKSYALGVGLAGAATVTVWAPYTTYKVGRYFEWW